MMHSPKFEDERTSSEAVVFLNTVYFDHPTCQAYTSVYHYVAVTITVRCGNSVLLFRANLRSVTPVSALVQRLNNARRILQRCSNLFRLFGPLQLGCTLKSAFCPQFRIIGHMSALASEHPKLSTDPRTVCSTEQNAFGLASTASQDEKKLRQEHCARTVPFTAVLSVMRSCPPS